ncbi:thioredoxin-disulfide reductase [Trueperella pyogenes]|uniref:Thioredoxin reductase n=1 Tax=Trueperella pyogenes TaxID=1661 RepID=A0A3S9QMA1_9ACTO|nr:thioredoxin-disulfide reductase [Trueperella pyogenes]AWG03690.1 thioredoxin-disulfide reductase [Trueperella pyogenes]AWG16421.1 thioredoxin-disulfide reductase [Trueperella pyogenes]AZR05301.1 thioredoxin-disulfide reductase [Trueperella pyogenes]AZR07067.1 thioredoxin-disulfide reductase [Trueperella pyogenes]QIU87805.1 thioredoxin-disulfide reductase [Trueperella pyogenes]
MVTEIHDVVIVGSGPAGWTAAIYTARAGLKPVVLAGAVSAGGALMQTTEVENFPGWPEGILGPELMQKFEQQAIRFGADLRYEDATSMKLDGAVKEIVTSEDTYHARTVILALGSEYKKLGLPGEEEFSGKGVSYCATCDGFFFRDHEIAVVGGGDSAVTEAQFLSRFAKTVHVIHRRDELRASQIMSDRLLANEKVQMHWNSVVDSINGDSRLQSLTLRDTVTGETSELPVTGLFVAIGHEPRTAFLEGVTLDDKGYIKVAEPSTATNVPGVFACGDVVDSTYQQAITAAGMGCKAALDAEAYLER